MLVFYFNACFPMIFYYIVVCIGYYIVGLYSIYNFIVYLLQLPTAMFQYPHYSRIILGLPNVDPQRPPILGKLLPALDECLTFIILSFPNCSSNFCLMFISFLILCK
jgi:hypothetical protein